MNQEIELNERMTERGDELDNATYQYLLTLLQIDQEKAEEEFPWDVAILREVLDSSISIVQKKGYAVCNPYIAEQGNIQYLCTLSECGCKECHCQKEFMEQERILARIHEAMDVYGIDVVNEENGKIVVNDKTNGSNYCISVTPYRESENAKQFK